MPRIFKREAIDERAVGVRTRKAVEYPNGARMIVEQLSKVGLAQPAVDALADLHADRLRYRRERPSRVAKIDLTEAALADQAGDAIAQRESVETRS